MSEDDGDGDTDELPEGFFKPGSMTTTADPEMRRRAQRTIEKHKKRQADGEDGG